MLTHAVNPKLRIFADTGFLPEAEELLGSGISPHQLLRPAVTASVLSSTTASLEGIDIALGQPDVASVLASSTLRWVHVTSAGYTRYDTPDFRVAAREKGLILTNSSRVYDEPCAEHLLAFLLAGARRLPDALRTFCESDTLEWHGLRRDSGILRGQSLVILGYGAIARHLVKLLEPFRMTITAVRRRPEGNEEIPLVSPEELPRVLAAADHVVNILPDNAGTRGFFNAERLAWIHPGALFYNVGRGTTVDQDALAEALRSGQIAQAWLDVTDPEPLPRDHPLRALGNCHITPHIAGGHRDESLNLVRHFLENFRRFLAGEPMLDRIL